MRSSNMIMIGWFKKAYGVRGLIWLKSLTQNPSDIVKLQELRFADYTSVGKLSLMKSKGTNIIVSIEGFTNRTQAETLQGESIFIDRTLLPNTQHDEFYHFDLIGMTVLDGNKSCCGTVLAIQNYGGGDLLEVQINNEKILLIPFIQSFITNIDTVNKSITVDSIEIFDI